MELEDATTTRSLWVLCVHRPVGKKNPCWWQEADPDWQKEARLLLPMRVGKSMHGTQSRDLLHSLVLFLTGWCLMIQIQQQGLLI